MIDFEQEIVNLFSPFSIHHFTKQSAFYDFRQALDPLEYRPDIPAIYTVEFAIKFQHERAKKIYQIIYKNLPLALISSNNYIREFAFLVQKQEKIDE